MNTNYKTSEGKRVEGTGVLATGRPGDVFFIPRNLTHGFSAVDDAVSLAQPALGRQLQ